jgi:hypothetical protein
MSISKSLITGVARQGVTRSLFNPVEDYFSETKVSTNPLESITDDYLKVLDTVKHTYGDRMVEREYEDIPRSQKEYVDLLANLKDLKDERSETKFKLLMEIAETALIGSYNSLSLYGENIVTAADKVILEKKVETILSEVNSARTITGAKMTNTFTITQNVRLAPIYNYYILIYGVPATDEGFDPDKLAFLSEVLVERGIDPYNIPFR